MRIGRYWHDASMRFLQPRQITGGVVTLERAMSAPTSTGGGGLQLVQTCGLFGEYGNDTAAEVVQVLGYVEDVDRPEYTLQAVQTFGLWDTTDADPTLNNVASGGLFS